MLRSVFPRTPPSIELSIPPTAGTAEMSADGEMDTCKADACAVPVGWPASACAVIGNTMTPARPAIAPALSILIFFTATP